ncbi:MAG: carotenoid oxygenase family protein [Candidatus Acidiferrales bacterium]
MASVYLEELSAVGAIRFPDIPIYQGFGAPSRLEADLRDCEVTYGAVPKDLNGILYRCGPDRQYPPLLGDDIFIDGEGMVVMFKFENGHVDYKSRYVRTERFKLQEKHRRGLFGRYRNRYTHDPVVKGCNPGTANTNVVWHAGKLFALKEDDMPYELNPYTLETVGRYDYRGGVKSVWLSAHPHLDQTTNELLTFAYQAKGDGTTDVAYYVIGPDGRVKHEVWFNAPWAGMVHDFAISDRYVIFPFFPLLTDVDVMKKGGPFYTWHRDKETVVAVVPRYGTADQVRWFRGPTSFAGHMMNGSTNGSKVSLDVCLSQGSSFFFFPNHDGAPPDPTLALPHLTRLTFDLAGNTEDFKTEQLHDWMCEMPRADDRYYGNGTYRKGYVICRDPSTPGAGNIGFGAVGEFDHKTGSGKLWNPGPDSGVQEPLFAPRKANSPEGDGYLLALVNRMAENRTDLAILDAQNIDAGPVAIIKLPHRVRMTFHGMWVSQEALESGRYSVARAGS